MFLPHVIGVWYNKPGNSRHRLFDDGGLINIRPRQNNPSMTILDPTIRAQVETIAHQLLEGVMPE